MDISSCPPGMGFIPAIPYFYRMMNRLKGLCFALTIPAWMSCSSGPETVRLTEKPLTEAVYASGFIRGESEVRIISQTEGIIEARRVSEGDTLKASSVLYILEHKPAAAKQAAAETQLRISQENKSVNGPALQEAEALLQTLRARMQFDSLQNQRYQNLLRQDAVSKVEAERIRLQYDNTRNEYQAQVNRVAQLHNRLEQDWMLARSSETLASFETSLFSITSPVSGIALKLNKEPGELVRRGEEVALLSNADGYILKLTIDEQDISRVTHGMPVLVKLDAWPDQIWKARVTRIYPLVNTREQSVQVDAHLDEPPSGLLSGMAAEANILIREKEKTWVLPRTAIFRDSVWVWNGSEKIRRAVQTGMVSLEEVEILSGITPEEEVLVVGE